MTARAWSTADALARRSGRRVQLVRRGLWWLLACGEAERVVRQDRGELWRLLDGRRP